MNGARLIENFLIKTHDYLHVSRDTTNPQMDSDSYFDPGDLTFTLRELQKLFEALYEEAVKMSENNKQKKRKLHIISHFILDSNGTDEKILYFGEKDIREMSSNSRPFLANNHSRDNRITAPWSRCIEEFFAILETFASENLKSIISEITPNMKYGSKENYNQRFAVLVSIFLAYYRADLARKYLKEHVAEKDEVVLEELAQTISKALISGRIWFVALKSKGFRMPFSTGFNLFPITYGESEKMYTIPFSQGYLVYSTSYDSPFYWSYIHAKEVLFSQNNLLAEDSLKEALNSNSKLYDQLNAGLEHLKSYTYTDLPYQDEHKISSFEQAIKDSIRDIDYLNEKTEEVIHKLLDFYKMDGILVNSLFLSVAEGGDVVELDFAKDSMVSFRSSSMKSSLEILPHAKTYIKDFTKALEKFYQDKETPFFFLN